MIPFTLHGSSLRERLQEGGAHAPACSRMLIVYQRSINALNYLHERQPASQFVFFADLVVMAERLHPIPFRTRP